MENKENNKLPPLTDVELNAIDEFSKKQVNKMNELTKGFKDFDLDKVINDLKIKKTSNDWYKELNDYLKSFNEKNHYTVYDPDGWDRSNFQFSWFEELITKEEFMRRTMFSTCLHNVDWNIITDWGKK